MCIIFVATPIIHIAIRKDENVFQSFPFLTYNISKYILSSLNYLHNPLAIIYLSNIANSVSKKTIPCNFFFRIHMLSLHRQKATRQSGHNRIMLPPKKSPKPAPECRKETNDIQVTNLKIIAYETIDITRTCVGRSFGHNGTERSTTCHQPCRPYSDRQCVARHGE